MIDEILSVPLSDLCDPDKILARQFLSRLVELKVAIKELLELRETLSAAYDIVKTRDSGSLLERLGSLIKSEQVLKETAEALVELMKLGDDSPAESWREVKRRATRALGSLPVSLGVKGAGGMFRCKEHGGYGFQADCGICQAEAAGEEKAPPTVGGLSGPLGLGAPVNNGWELTAEEMYELSWATPHLACVVNREPPRAVEETRKRAREELAWLLRLKKKVSGTDDIIGKAREEGVEAVRRAWKRAGYPGSWPFPIVYPHDYDPISEPTTKGK